jgi:hypothetical protein
VNRAPREIVEVSCARLHWITVNLEVNLAVENVISFVPVMAVRRRAHPERDLLFEQ